MRITIVLAGHGLASTVIGPLEIFKNAGVLWNTLNGTEPKAAFEVVTVSIDGAPVDYDDGVTIAADRSLAQVRKTDVILVPAIGLNPAPVVAEHQRTIEWIARQARKGTLVAGVCSGVTFLAEAGILDQRRATTHWALAKQYEEKYPNVEWRPERFITESDNVLCGGGVYSSLDLSLYLVEKLAGHEIARQCARGLLIDSPRTWQASFNTPLLNREHKDEKIRRIQDHLHEYYDARLTVEDLARRAGMSPRNFSRRFKQATGETPLGYLHQLRITRAKQLLETDYKSVQEICFAVGYEDVAFFRDVFKRYSGYAPKEYRQRFATVTEGTSC
jgi:transcriptional regulator GlxA family with amidase domain